MSLDARLDVSTCAAPAFEGQITDEVEAKAMEAVEAVEGVDFTELPVYVCPARGIFNAVVIGAGAWTIILTAFALTRGIFFG
jgi:hypothetical protein